MRNVYWVVSVFVGVGRGERGRRILCRGMERGLGVCNWGLAGGVGVCCVYPSHEFDRAPMEQIDGSVVLFL